MIVLPAGVVPNNIIPALIDFGGVQRPPLGGKLLRINRLGNRYRAAVTLPPIPNDAVGRVVVSRLLQARTQGLRIEYPLCGVDQGAPGTPRVKGAGQAGTQIDLDGFTPGYTVAEGYWLSIVTGGQHYLYNSATGSVADAGGNVTVHVTPALRRPPADNDLVHIVQPMIEGLVTGDEQRWNYSLAHHLNIEFEIEEAE